jgi:hypothetical protein
VAAAAVLSATVVAVAAVRSPQPGSAPVQLPQPQSSQPQWPQQGPSAGGPAPASEPTALSGRVFYVSPSGNNSGGTSWATAWKDTSDIDWSSVRQGSNIVLDGGTSRCGDSPYDFKSSTPNPGVTCGKRYSAFAVGDDHVTILRATDAGHDGTVVIDGGRDTPLPYCGQPGYSAPSGARYGIDLGSHTGVTIDGRARSGIIVRGAQNGIRMGPGGHDTLRNLELFDNGYPRSESFGYSTDGNDILMGGQDNVYDRLLVHDGGQDEFHSDGHGYSETGSTVSNTWMGAMREHPLHPGEPFNDLQASGNNPRCTHADGIQIFAPGSTMSGLTIDHDVFGPGINQGLFPSDGGTGTTFDDVSVTDTLFLAAASHNINNVNPVHGWRLDHDTIVAPHGGSGIPSDGPNTITNTVKFGGYVAMQGGSWTTSGNDWFGGDPLPGTSSKADPGFASSLSGTLPPLATLLAANFTPSCPGCTGSPIHSMSDLLRRIDALNAGVGEP